MFVLGLELEPSSATFGLEIFQKGGWGVIANMSIALALELVAPRIWFREAISSLTEDRVRLWLARVSVISIPSCSYCKRYSFWVADRFPIT